VDTARRARAALKPRGLWRDIQGAVSVPSGSCSVPGVRAEYVRRTPAMSTPIQEQCRRSPYIRIHTARQYADAQALGRCSDHGGVTGCSDTLLAHLKFQAVQTTRGLK
jgi:hypothetical protein